MNRSLIAVLALVACGNEAAYQNDGDRAQLGISGDSLPLLVGVRTELGISRTETGPGKCQYDVTHLASYCSAALFTKVLAASCEGHGCDTFIVDRYTVDVTGLDAGVVLFTVMVELADGGVVADSTHLTFVNE